MRGSSAAVGGWPHHFRHLGQCASGGVPASFCMFATLSCVLHAYTHYFYGRMHTTRLAQVQLLLNLAVEPTRGLVRNMFLVHSNVAGHSNAGWWTLHFVCSCHAA